MKVNYALLNCPVLTNFGSYRYREIPLYEAQDIAQTQNVKSYIGHQSTADVLSKLLGVRIAVNRKKFQQGTDFKNSNALVFQLNDRPPEGKILTAEEIEKLNYSFGVLYRVS